MKKGGIPAVPAYAFSWLGVCLLLATAPAVFFLNPVIWIGFSAGVIWRWRIAIRGAERPGAIIRFLVLFSGLGFVVMLHHSILSVAPGLEILLVLVTAKILEMRTRREFLFVTFLGLFLALTTLFFQQTMGFTGYTLIACLGFFATAMRFHLGSRLTSWKDVFFPLGRMAIQALPIVLLLFLFFPRTRAGFILSLSSPISVMGMSDSLNPGDYAQLAGSDALAFRADFPDKNTPPARSLYWRGVVLLNCEGLHWSRGFRGMDTQEVPPSRGARVTQRITLEPHGRNWMFCLDHPVSVARDAKLMNGAFLEKHGAAISKRLAPYFVESCLGPDATPMDQRIRRRTLQLPKEGFSERVWQLVNEWKAKSDDPEEIAKTAMKYFRTEPFRYTTKPGRYAGAGLDEFLFDRRAGFCEHYAAAFSALMRAAGVPSRVVGGYRGGLYNSVGDYIAVHQMDAHAWSEIWVQDKGWIRFDPADAIDPSRVTAEVPERLRTGAGAWASSDSGDVGGKWRWNVLGETARLLWDNVNYHWDLWVVGFDQETQFQFFSHIGLDENPWLRAGLIILCGMGMTLLILWVIMRWTRVKTDPVLNAYRALCARFARAGAPKGTAEGPTAYAERLRGKFPELGGQIGEVFGDYVAIRYNPDARVQKRSFLSKCRKLKPPR